MSTDALSAHDKFAGPGETVVFQAGEVHKFWNAADAPAPVRR